MTIEVLIALDGVSVAAEGAPWRILLQDVGWQIRPGEWWVVSGGQSSGKSDLLATAAGLLPAATGRRRILGQDPEGLDEGALTALRRQVGFVFEQGGRLLGGLSVAENVTLGAAYHEDLAPEAARERALELLALAGLESLADAPASRLRPSVQQRVALLRALAVSPRVLFLDAPLRGLPRHDVAWWLGFLVEERIRRAAGGAPLTLVTSGFDPVPWREHADHFGHVEDGNFACVPPPDVGA